MQTHFDAIIIGAGPAGSTAAILLARAGWSVAILEKQRFPRRKVCGECVAAPNLALLDALGVGSSFSSLAGPDLRQVALMTGKASIVADLPALPHGRYQWGRALGREHLDSLLLDRATQSGATVFQPWSARAISGQPGAFTCEVRHIESGEHVTLTAPVMIAAHGSWALQPTEDTARPPQCAGDLFAFKANFRNASLAPGLLPVLAFDGGYGGMVVGDHGLTTLACCIRRDTLHGWRRRTEVSRAGEAVELYLKANCRGVDQALTGAVREGMWLGTGPIRPGIRMPHGGGGIFRIGNAAGEAHPIIGEGMSMAMQSAWLLCGFLTRHRSRLLTHGPQHQIHRAYAAAWRRNFALRIRLAAVFAHLAMRPKWSAGLLPLLQRHPGLLTWSARWSGKISSPDICDPALPAIPSLGAK